MYDFIAAGVAMRTASNRVAGGATSEANVEDVANAIESLIARRKSDVAPFVASWHSVLEDAEHVSDVPYTARHEVSVLLQRKFVEASSNEIDTMSTDWSQFAAQLIAAINTPKLSDSFLRQLRIRLPFEVMREVTMRASADVSYLAALTALRSDLAPFAIATLNYDVTLEAALQLAGASYSDGLEGWTRGIDDLFDGASTRIYKLHGSVSWERDDADHYRHVTEDTLEFVPGIIFGGRNKLTVRGPYLDLLWRWRRELELCDGLLIVGYSFVDDHVNSLIVQWARLARPRRIAIVDPGFTSLRAETGVWLKHCEEYPSEKLEVFSVLKGAKDGLNTAIAWLSRP
jgi:hypothetical protein